MQYIHEVSVVFVTDQNYLIPTWVAARSCAESKNGSTKLNIYIIGDHLIDKDKESLTTAASDIAGVSMHFIDVNSAVDFKGVVSEEALKSWSPAVLYKFMLADILPDYLHKAIYLDGDMIIRHDLSDLYESNLDANQLLGAVRDTFYDNLSHEKRMNLPGQYFNTGCLLLNLVLMRQEKISYKLINMKIARPDLGLADQDTYNEICRNRVKLLSCRYNFYITNFILNEDQEGFSKYTVCPYDDRMKMIDDIAVIHMIHYRPWKSQVSESMFKATEKYVVPDIRKASLAYVFDRWMELYKKSPFVSEEYNFASYGSLPFLSGGGLVSFDRRGRIKFKVIQDCHNGKICVSYLLGKMRLITKVTDPSTKKIQYEFFR